LGLYIDEFAEQLSQQGYSRQYARRRLQLVAELSHWLRRPDLAVADLTLTHLGNYLRFRARSRRRRPGDAASLKAFFELLHQKGLPKSLPLQHVKRVLASCNRKTAIGRRDYAMLLLLARLGLRAGEVVSLALDDIDWEAGYLTVRGKGDRRAPLPLPADVGKAIAAYLKYGRPRSTSRCVFLRGRAPASSFKSSPAVSTVVRHALARAGIDRPRKGAHQFRHTLATEMLRQGVSLREIGDLLHHRHPQTTTIYAKVDLVSLRTLGLAWPGGAR
jgi:integrase/recombinase XerD